MEIFINPSAAEWERLCGRNIPDDSGIEESVIRIKESVLKEGDCALKKFASEFDHVDLKELKVSRDEIDASSAKVGSDLKKAIDTAKENIEKFHAAQQTPAIEVEIMPGVKCYQRQIPVERVGLYIPGGRSPLFSTVLMLGIPAMIAGCKEVALFTPRSAEYGISPEILYAASICGIDEVYAVGGAQAIFAMAYGTSTIKPVKKIFGPGNRYVTKAKQMVADKVAIDMPAGPSEVLVMADSSANAEFVASDLLSQAEHGPDSQAMLVCDDADFARQVGVELERLKAALPRLEIIEKSLSQSRIIVLNSRERMIDFVNRYAPEHLIISMSDPWEIAGHITAAGSVFIGNYSPESAGDYASGTNHTLPTSGWAASYSGLNLDSFFHKITYQELTKAGLARLAPVITSMAEAESLGAHALAVKVRMK